MYKVIALASLLAILILINWSIAGKEYHLANGKIVYLDLAPIDPRSLMQGDYMALRFSLARQVYDNLPKSTDKIQWRQQILASDGFVVVSLDEKDVASFKELYMDKQLEKNEILLRYRVRRGNVKFATNTFFFQEGHANDYQIARYGQFRVNDKGDLLLVAMFDKDLNKLINKQKNK